ncbi:(DL)-glycerol-3-phosphatase 2 [Lingula anatina]|uniref:(DL)-glycerol-3-phosphatase 2 n=1 Tax=Lingula anatina TaxID=7574 RepID=A0A2R2MJ93_LINAN|nr:(DL)-glycerol-3-phosphatase 2 [Lingula anatina]|eukprot:XP_023930280.1 (DL)-glycerol-3-phosphatase 2 [Lingula anatina]
MSKYNPVTHVIFDMDGLLLDTERLYTEATQMLLDEYGEKFTWEIKNKQMGKKAVEAARIIIGAEKLVHHLHRNNIPICVATGSSKMNYEMKTQKHKDFFSLFHHVVLSSDDPEVTHGKPAPDCFLVAARRFEDKPSPEKVLVFEDATNGALASVAAGMQCVWIPDERADQSQLRDKVTLILKSLEEFKPEDFGLPPYEDSS